MSWHLRFLPKRRPQPGWPRSRLPEPLTPHEARSRSKVFLQHIPDWHEDRSEPPVSESVGAECPGEAPHRRGVGTTVAKEIDNREPLLKLSVSSCLEHGVDLLSLLAFPFGDLQNHRLDRLLPGLEGVWHHLEIADAVQAGKAAIRSDIAGRCRHPLRDELDDLDGRLAVSLPGVLHRYETEAEVRDGQVRRYEPQSMAGREWTTMSLHLSRRFWF